MGERLVVREDVIETDPEIEGHCDELPEIEATDETVGEVVIVIDIEGDSVAKLDTDATTLVGMGEREGVKEVVTEGDPEAEYTGEVLSVRD